MVVRCINNEGLDGYLSKGSQYEIMADKTTHWKITADNGVVIVVDKERFEDVIEEAEIV